MYLLVTHPKGYSSQQLAKTLGIGRTSAWHLEHRIREGFTVGTQELLAGPVEVDETFFCRGVIHRAQPPSRAMHRPRSERYTPSPHGGEGAGG